MAQFDNAILSQSCEKLNDIALKYLPYNQTVRVSERVTVICKCLCQMMCCVLLFNTEFVHFICLINIPSVHFWTKTKGPLFIIILTIKVIIVAKFICFREIPGKVSLSRRNLIQMNKYLIKVTEWRRETSSYHILRGKWSHVWYRIPQMDSTLMVVMG